jgi:hypothetical protein
MGCLALLDPRQLLGFQSLVHPAIKKPTTFIQAKNTQARKKIISSQVQAPSEVPQQD